MTLHWWMHWFWVTALLTFQCGSGWTIAIPNIAQLRVDNETDSQPADRQPRAMYFTKTSLKPTTPTTSTEKINTINETQLLHSNTANDTEPNKNNDTVNWTPVNITDIVTVNTTMETKNNTIINATVQETNSTDPRNNSEGIERNNLTKHPKIKDYESIETAAESKIVTEKPLSLETSFLQTRIPPNIESSRRVNEQRQPGMDTGEIAGISFAALVLAGLAGSTAFVLYRRRYLNKPQTLNDKCSNPDSSGYLDDSTIRDNSEEMYSLDNDSFLNSLEAMTIQNYWTDTVKHTKL